MTTANALAGQFPDRVMTPSFVFQLSSRQARHVVEAMLLADGDNPVDGSRERVNCGTRQKSDILQALCVVAGYATTCRWGVTKPNKLVPNGKGCWKVAILRRKRVQVTAEQRTVLQNQAQLVWCPQVENQTFVARRKGNVYITGNSPIQGTAGDLTIYAAYMIWKAFKKHKLKSLLVNCVHDSIYVDCPEEEVPIVNAIMADIMDNTKMWLPSLLKGFNADWIDIPIIGECELGLDAKDVVTAVEEFSLTDPSKELKFKIPTDKEGKKLIQVPGDLLVWDEHKDLIRGYLEPIRKQNEWHTVAKNALTT